MSKKLITKELTHEQQLQHFIESECLYVPSPPERCKYNIGDTVNLGMLENVKIIGVYHDYKVYEIEYSSTNNNYGNPVTTHGHTRFVEWFRVRKAGENFRSNTSAIKNQHLVLNFSNGVLMGLLSKVYFFGTEMNPDYQRDYVWDQRDKESLIQSVFDNIDIGKFVFVHYEWRDREDHKGNEILDGKQRLNALCEFYEERWAWNGRYYSDLTAREQTWFENYPVSWAEMRNADRKQKIEMFLKLNRTGKVMDKDHLLKVENMIR